MKNIDELKNEIYKEDVRMVESEIIKVIRSKGKSCYIYFKDTTNIEKITEELKDGGYDVHTNGSALTIYLK